MAQQSLSAAIVGKACHSARTSKRWELVDRADITRAALGREFRLRADWGSQRPGEVTHVKALHLRAWVDIEVPDVTNEPISAYQLRAFFQQIRLQLNTGQILMEHVDGRQVLDDQYCRAGELANLEVPLHFGVQGQYMPEITDDNGLPADAGADTYRIPIGLTIHLGSPVPTANPLRGLVPAHLLAGSGDTGLTLQIASTIPAIGGLNPPKVTGLYRGPFEHSPEGLDVWAELVDLPAAVSSGYSRLVTWTDSDLSGNLKGIPHQSRVMYCAIRPQFEDGRSAYSAVTVKAGGRLLMSALSEEDATTQTILEAWSRRGAERLNNAQLALPIVDNKGPTLLYLVPPRDRAAAPMAPIGFSFSRTKGQGAQDTTRYLARVVEPLTPERALRTEAALKRDCGCGSKAAGTNATGGRCAVTPYEPVLLNVARLR